MISCPSCACPIDDGLRYLDARGKVVSSQARAAWKTCPHCSDLAGVHVYLPCPSAFGTTEKRVTPDNPMGLHSWCIFHRNSKNVALENEAAEKRACVGAAPPGRQRGVTEAEPSMAPLTNEQRDALIDALVGGIELSEEGRKVLRTHLETERRANNRRVILRLRSAKGQLECDACGADLAKRYGQEHATVLELHHRQPLARGAQKPHGLDDFALLCPTCHRVVHYRRVEPLDIADVRRLIGVEQGS